MAKPFGRDCIIVGQVYEMCDIVARDRHVKPEHTLCVPRAVEVSELDGAIRVGVAFHGANDSSQPEKVDSLGYALEPTCWCFPSDLRKV